MGGRVAEIKIGEIEAPNLGRSRRDEGCKRGRRRGGCVTTRQEEDWSPEKLFSASSGSKSANNERMDAISSLPYCPCTPKPKQEQTANDKGYKAMQGERET